MAVKDQIEALEGELINCEQGSKDWQTNMQLLSKMYEIQNEKDQIDISASVKEDETKSENKKFWISAIKDVAVCVLGAVIAGAFQLLYIDEISEFEKSDSYTGRKTAFLPKGHR